ncbi:MAG: fasciclin domain-containing protein [Microcystaceae cyanobacterium]
MKLLGQSRLASLCLGLVALSTPLLFPNVAVSAEDCTKSQKTSAHLVAGGMKSPTSEKTKPTTTGATTETTTGTIVEVAAGNDSFKTLVAAIQAAGLVETLSGKGPFTVFAPTDKAFAALPKGTVENLLKPENKAKLQKVLTYHVIAGEVTSKMVKPGNVNTAEGSPVKISVNGDKVMVGRANVIAVDVDASNGVIHVIDQVLLPPNL